MMESTFAMRAWGKREESQQGRRKGCASASQRKHTSALIQDLDSWTKRGCDSRFISHPQRSGACTCPQAMNSVNVVALYSAVEYCRLAPRPTIGPMQSANKPFPIAQCCEMVGVDLVLSCTEYLPPLH